MTMPNLRKIRNCPAALTIAGSDSGGGAGLQADLRTFSYFRVFGTCAVTTVTMQNPLTVAGIEAVTPVGVEAQIRTVRNVINLAGAKTGMLFSAEIIERVAFALRDFAAPLVVDPVMIATSGGKLLRDDAVDALRNSLLKLAAWITPNLPEAEVLTGTKISSPSDAVRAAKACAARWRCGVVLKGGHTAGPEAADVVVHNGECFFLAAPRIPVEGHAGHGTGCTFSAALTALLARSTPWKEALILAKTFVLASLSRPVRLGRHVCGMYPPEEDLAHFRPRIVCRDADS